MTAYYNEIDKFAAQWLRELIKVGAIAPGYVDERSIEDVTPSDLKGFTQCHFFAGVGVWSYSLRMAGWPDNRPIWTGSCPCQPFSAAGKGAGFNDERHLWPAFAWLIKQCKPTDLLGEQVASRATGPWFDLVQTDLEAMGYAFGVIPFPAAGVGAPHIRDRAYWAGKLADDSGTGLEGHRGFIAGANSQGWQGAQRHSGSAGMVSGMANDMLQQRQSATTSRNEQGGRQQEAAENSGLCSTGKLPNTINSTEQRSITRPIVGKLPEVNGTMQTIVRETGPVNGFWSDADWLSCRDGKWRPVEPGSFPLVNGTSSRVGRLRGYGNAIVSEAAIQFIKAYSGAIA